MSALLEQISMFQEWWFIADESVLPTEVLWLANMIRYPLASVGKPNMYHIPPGNTSMWLS